MMYSDIEIERKGKIKNEIDVIESNTNMQMDKLISECYTEEHEEHNRMFLCYKKSLEELKNLTKDLGSFPSTKVWNKYALKNDCLSYVSMEYISKLNWHKLKRKIKLEISSIS